VRTETKVSQGAIDKNKGLKTWCQGRACTWIVDWFFISPSADTTFPELRGNLRVVIKSIVEDDGQNTWDAFFRLWDFFCRKKPDV
jgi:hypothetical protein